MMIVEKLITIVAKITNSWKENIKFLARIFPGQQHTESMSTVSRHEYTYSTYSHKL